MSHQNKGNGKTLLIAGMFGIGMLLTGIAVPMVMIVSAQLESSSFKFEYTRTGGIAGVNERLVFDSKTNTIKFYGTAGVAEKRLSDASVQSIRQAIADNSFFDMQSLYPPKETGVADYFSYTLTVTMDGKSHSVSWVDDFASSVPVPTGLAKITSEIERQYADASDAPPPKRRISETTVLKSSSHDADGHASHQAAYLVPAHTSYIYRGAATFTVSEPVDILVYHDITGIDNGQLKGLTVHVVNGRSYAVTSLLRNVTAGTVDFVGAAVLAHETSGDPFTVVASIDALRKTLQRPAIEGKSFTIDVAGEKFVVYATDSQTIQQLVDNYNGKNSFHVTGKIARGNGGFNQPWSWHIDPDTVRMAEISIELCDGRPSFVQEDLDYWLNTVGSYCPWSSKVVGINN